MNIKEVIIAHMGENGITYRDVAGKIGSTQQNVWNILNGKDGNKPGNTKGARRPRLESIKQICEAVGLALRVVPIPGAEKPDLDAVLKAEELDAYSFDAIQTIIQKFGYKLTVEKQEEK